MRQLLFAAFLIAATCARAGDFNYDAYRTASLVEVADSMGTPPGVGVSIDAAHSKYHIVAVFTGKTRPIATEVRAFVEMWAKSLRHPPEVRELFQFEVELRQGPTIYWMPIQKQLIGPLLREVAPGDEVHLYMLLMGALNRNPVLGVSEFEAVGSNQSLEPTSVGKPPSAAQLQR